MSKSISKGVLGLGEASTAYYLNQIHQKFNERNEEFSTCPLLLYQVDFQEINPFLPDQFEELVPRVTEYLNKISELGISKLLVPNITLHETLDQITHSIELCHPVQLTVEHLIKNKISEIVIFGTLYTMNSEYLKINFSEAGINIIPPESEDQLWIDDFRKQVYKKESTADEIEAFQSLIKKYMQQKPVVISCTELSIHCLKDENYCIDMADLQIEGFLK